jgi:hypothetical protein
VNPPLNVALPFHAAGGISRKLKASELAPKLCQTTVSPTYSYLAIHIMLFFHAGGCISTNQKQSDLVPFVHAAARINTNPQPSRNRFANS